MLRGCSTPRPALQRRPRTSVLERPAGRHATGQRPARASPAASNRPSAHDCRLRSCNSKQRRRCWSRVALFCPLASALGTGGGGPQQHHLLCLTRVGLSIGLLPAITAARAQCSQGVCACASSGAATGAAWLDGVGWGRRREAPWGSSARPTTALPFTHVPQALKECRMHETVLARVCLGRPVDSSS